MHACKAFLRSFVSLSFLKKSADVLNEGYEKVKGEGKRLDLSEARKSSQTKKGVAGDKGDVTHAAYV